MPSFEQGPDLFDRLQEVNWDVLLILDACRFDVLSEVAETAVIQPIRSPASSTPEFLDQARERGVFEGTIYVSANPQTEKKRPGTDISLRPAYEEGWENRLGTVPADRVFGVVRNALEESNTVVGHVMQPHYPHICRIDGHTLPVPNGLHPREFEDDNLEKSGLQALLASGAVSLNRARRSYEICLRYAWESASSFAASLASEGYHVAVTADHGELFGERGFVEHPVGIRIDPLVTVPWVTFGSESTESHQTDTKDQLKALGYVDD